MPVAFVIVIDHHEVVLLVAVPQVIGLKDNLIVILVAVAANILGTDCNHIALLHELLAVRNKNTVLVLVRYPHEAFIYLCEEKYLCVACLCLKVGEDRLCPELDS